MLNLKVKGIKSLSPLDAHDYPLETGFELDSMLATVSEISGKPGEYNTIRGLRNGSVIMIAGVSGCGKSLLGLNLLKNMMRKYRGSQSVILDTEGGYTPEFMKSQIGLTDRELDERVSVIPPLHTTIEVARDIIEQIVEDKKENVKKYEYNTGIKDSRGNPVMGVIPTFIMIDSLMHLREEKKTDEVRNNMSYATDIKAYSELIDDITKYAKAYNINLILVVHSGDVINTGFTQPIKKMQTLGNNIVINGGKRVKYAASLILYGERYLASKSEDIYKAVKVEGGDYVVKWVIAKSRFSAINANIFLSLMKMKSGGFDNINSILYSIKEVYKILDRKGSVYSFYEEYLPNPRYDKGWRMADFRELVLQNGDFREDVGEALDNYWSKILCKKVVKDDEDLTDDISIF